MKVLLFFFVITSFSSIAQTYFFEDFNYTDFDALDSLYQFESNRSIWSTKHAINGIDFNENGIFDLEEDIKNSSIIEDPVDPNNKVIFFELKKVDPFVFAKYSCDDPENNNVLADSTLINNYNREVNLYCVDCSQSPMKTALFEYKTHMNRNELAIYGRKRDLYKAKKDHWFGLKMFVDNNYQIDSTKTGEIITQFHLKSFYGNPPIALLIHNGRFVLTIIKNNDNKGVNYDLGPVEKNKWIEWKLHVIISKKDKDGLVELWKDGEQWVSVKGKNCYVNKRVYLKIGIYKWGWWSCKSPYTTTNYKAIYYDKVWANDQDITQN